MRSRYSHTAILVGVACLLSACAEKVPAPTVVAAPPVIEAPPPKPRAVTRARRNDHGCTQAKLDLPQDRKEALFRQFDAALGPIAAASATPSPPPAPAPGSDCRQAVR